MKRILILTILLMSSLAWAGSTTVVVGQGGGGAPATAEITDAFGSDTSANYTAITGGIGVSGGVASGTSAWVITIVYHETALSSADHYVQALVSENDYDGGGLIARSDGTHYYKCGWDGDLIRLYRDSTPLGGANYNGGYLETSGTHTLKLSVSGTGATVTIKLYIDGTERISFDDTDAGRLTSGSYVGLTFDRDSSNPAVTADDFEADAL